jgi:magnesium chelatase accessory protein
MSARLGWERDGLDWPNRAASRFVSAGGLQWHVQQMGEGPDALLAHGTGSATHSWRLLAPLLARHFRVIAPDLPGHGFTGAAPAHGMSLTAMAGALGELLHTLEVRPAYAAGHSAGAAILARMCLDRALAPAGLASLNGALLPMRGLAGALLSPFAKMLAAGPLLPSLFVRHVSRGSAVERLLEGTGSRIDPEGVAFYRKLARNPAHAAAALAMMAQWNLPALARDLPRLEVPLLLVVGDGDRAIRPSEAKRIRALVPGATLRTVAHAGHLAHEEHPHAVAGILLEHARSVGAVR